MRKSGRKRLSFCDSLHRIALIEDHLVAARRHQDDLHEWKKLCQFPKAVHADTGTGGIEFVRHRRRILRRAIDDRDVRHLEGEQLLGRQRGHLSRTHQQHPLALEASIKDLAAKVDRHVAHGDGRTSHLGLRSHPLGNCKRIARPRD